MPKSANCNVRPIDPSKSRVGSLDLDLGYISPIGSSIQTIGDRTVPAILNVPRSEALRTARLDSWIALSEDESAIVATGNTYEDVSQQLDKAGLDNAIIIKTPKSWTPFAV